MSNQKRIIAEMTAENQEDVDLLIDRVKMATNDTGLSFFDNKKS